MVRCFSFYYLETESALNAVSDIKKTILVLVLLIKLVQSKCYNIFKNYLMNFFVCKLFVIIIIIIIYPSEGQRHQ